MNQGQRIKNLNMNGYQQLNKLIIKNLFDSPQNYLLLEII